MNGVDESPSSGSGFGDNVKVTPCVNVTNQSQSTRRKISDQAEVIESPIHSTSELRSWLTDFERKNRNHYEKNREHYEKSKDNKKRYERRLVKELSTVMSRENAVDAAQSYLRVLSDRAEVSEKPIDSVSDLKGWLTEFGRKNKEHSHQYDSSKKPRPSSVAKSRHQNRISRSIEMKSVENANKSGVLVRSDGTVTKVIEHGGVDADRAKTQDQEDGVSYTRTINERAEEVAAPYQPVSELKTWLVDFGRRNKEHYDSRYSPTSYSAIVASTSKKASGLDTENASAEAHDAADENNEASIIYREEVDTEKESLFEDVVLETGGSKMERVQQEEEEKEATADAAGTELEDAEEENQSNEKDASPEIEQGQQDFVAGAEINQEESVHGERVIEVSLERHEREPLKVMNIPCEDHTISKDEVDGDKNEIVENEEGMNDLSREKYWCKQRHGNDSDMSDEKRVSVNEKGETGKPVSCNSERSVNASQGPASCAHLSADHESGRRIAEVASHHPGNNSAAERDAKGTTSANASEADSKEEKKRNEGLKGLLKKLSCASNPLQAFKGRQNAENQLENNRKNKKKCSNDTKQEYPSIPEEPVLTMASSADDDEYVVCDEGMKSPAMSTLGLRGVDSRSEGVMSSAFARASALSPRADRVSTQRVFVLKAREQYKSSNGQDSAQTRKNHAQVESKTESKFSEVGKLGQTSGLKSILAPARREWDESSVMSMDSQLDAEQSLLAKLVSLESVDRVAESPGANHVKWLQTAFQVDAN